MYGAPLAGRYAIRRELGSGAYARVYLADDQKLGRAVAVKVLGESSASSPEAIQRLEREGRFSSLINHPNVCAVLDVGRLDGGLPFLVMEYLSGETLADRIEREKRLPLAVAVGFAEQMLLGLYAAHRLGIVHRDVKPANVFLVDLGLGQHLLKLLDFGTAYRTGSESDAGGATLTRAGLVVGTPEYMAPEQLRGLRNFDARTDVYASGVVLYEMLSGRRPFGGLPLDQLCQAIAFKQAPPLAGVAPSVPQALARAVDVALALNPSRRHADAAAFLAALRNAAAAAPPELAPTAGIDAVTQDRLPAGADDEWNVPTTNGAAAIAGAPAAQRPSAEAAAEWDLTTHQTGPPSGIGAPPLTVSGARNAPGSVSIDVDFDEAAAPSKPRPPRR